MFQNLRIEISDRFLTVNRLMTVIKSLESSPSNRIEYSALKGMMFVHLYAIYEYTTTKCVQTILSHIRDIDYSALDVKWQILPLALNSKFDSSRDCGKSRLWETRIKLAEAIHSSNSLIDEIDDAAFPYDGSHFRFQQLQTIWSLLDLSEPIVPNPRLLNRINEIVDFRNIIAHGTDKPEIIGSRYSTNDIDDRYKDMYSICFYVIDTLDAHCYAGNLIR